MKKIVDKLRTLVWFVKRPRFFPQIIQLLKRKKNRKLEDSVEASTAWSREKVISPREALKLLHSLDGFQELSEHFPDIVGQAELAQSKCPVKMGGQGAISFLYQLCRANKVKVAVESGVAYGWSSLAILLAIKDTEGAILISNDMPYIKMNNDDYVGCVVPDSLRSKWKLQCLPDVIGLPKAFKKINRPLDLFHYDSDKSYTGRMWASPIIWRQLKKGGLFVSDDINDNLAFKHFAESVNRDPVIIEHRGKYVGIIRK